MTWWDTLIQYLTDQWALTGSNAVNWATSWNPLGAGMTIVDTVDAFTQYFTQFLSWIPPLIQLSPVIFALWFLDVAITALIDGEVAPLGRFIGGMATILVGIAQTLTEAIPL